MENEFFVTNGQPIGLTMAGYMDWFAHRDRIGTLKSSVMEYCVSELIDSLKSPYGLLYKTRNTGDTHLMDGITIDLRWAEWEASETKAARDTVTFPICISKWPDAIIFGLHDLSERYHPILDLDAWDFYSISGSKLKQACGDTAIISLPSLLMLGPVWSDFNGIPEALSKIQGA